MTREEIIKALRCAAHKTRQQDTIFSQLAKIGGIDFAKRAYEIVKAEANAYGIDAEIGRMECAARLILAGIEQEAVLDALKNQEEYLYLLLGV